MDNMIAWADIPVTDVERAMTFRSGEPPPALYSGAGNGFGPLSGG
jgi:hypothetical protein